MEGPQFWLREVAGFPLLPLDDLDWVEAVRDYVHLHAGRRSRLVRATMAQAETNLAPAGFLRIHRSTLVRAERVAGLRRSAGRGLQIQMTSGAWLSIAPARAQAVTDALGLRRPTEEGAIFVGCGRERRRVRLSEVRMIEAEGDYVRLHAPDRAVLHRATLKHMQTLFPPGEMLRVGRSALVRRSLLLAAE